jgi:hypothetical protein
MALLMRRQLRTRDLPSASAALAQGDGAGGEKKSPDDDAGEAAAVIAEQTKLANERYKTAAPDKSFESLGLLEKFRRAPPIKAPNGATMQLGKVLTASLLFGKSVQKTKGTITSATTYSAFGSRPKVYTSPKPLPALVFPKGRLKLAVHGYGSGGDAREVLSSSSIFGGRRRMTMPPSY